MDYYQLLGLPRDATESEIRRKYRLAAKRYHPDTNTNSGDTEIFLQVQEAYRVLSDPQRRAAYDATLPPEKKPHRDLAIQIYYSLDSIRPLDEPQVAFAMLEISALRSTSPQRPPLNVCLVIDRSTSMKGKKMDATKSTAIKLLRSLGPGDIFSIVSFSDYADVVVPAGYYGDIARAEVKIQMLSPAGGTEIFRGLKLAVNEVRRFRDAARVNHIILLTDGRTYGDEEKALKLADLAASEGIFISAMGLGTDWNDNFLDDLAARTGGSSSYIAAARDIEHFLLGRIKSLENIYANDLLLDYFLDEQVDLTYVYRAQPDPLALPPDVPLALGSVPYDQPLQIVFEFTINQLKKQIDTKLLLSGRLQADILSSRGHTYQTHIRLMRPVAESTGAAALEKKMMTALADMALYRLQEKAQNQADAGDPASAAQYLQYLATHLFEKGDDFLARTALLEADNVLKQGRLTDSGRKNIKYGTRALLLSPKQKGGRS